MPPDALLDGAARVPFRNRGFSHQGRLSVVVVIGYHWR